MVSSVTALSFQLSEAIASRSVAESQWCIAPRRRRDEMTLKYLGKMKFKKWMEAYKDSGHG